LKAPRQSRDPGWETAFNHTGGIFGLFAQAEITEVL